MKKISFVLILLLFAGVNSFSQKKSGTLYSEHETIDITKEVWKAFVAGDAEKYRSFFADSAYLMNHGERTEKTANADIGAWLPKWVGNYEGLKVYDDKPGSPDALVYKEGQVFTQDWIRFAGIHKETGIRLDVPIHNLYGFNEAGKITVMVSYFNNNIFEEISASKKKKENGKVFINHPHIVTVRKMVNAFMARDVEKLRSFYAEKATYSSTVMEWGKSQSIDDHIDYLSETFFKEGLKFKVEQVGYPDCIYYDKNEMYVVYSWWKMTVKKDGEVSVIPFMMSNNFNEEGKITSEITYISSNHLEGL